MVYFAERTGGSELIIIRFYFLVAKLIELLDDVGIYVVCLVELRH